MAKGDKGKVVKRRPVLRGAHLKGVSDHLKRIEKFAKLKKRKR